MKDDNSNNYPLKNESLNELKTKSSENIINTLLNEKDSTASNKTNEVKENNLNASDIKSNNTNNKQTEEGSNPFIDAFREMKKTPNNNNNNDLFGFLQNLGGNKANGGHEDFDNITGLYDILGKLSDEETHNLPEQDKAKHLASLFGNLLDYLLKSDMLEQPLTQIKQSVVTYIETNKEKIKAEELVKYEQLLDYVNTILIEIKKTNPDKPLIIDIFYKLHELSDFDDNLMSNVNPYLKDFSEMFGNSFKK